MQQPLRRVPVPLREVLEDTLDDLVQQDILAPVQQPTPLLGGHPEKKMASCTSVSRAHGVTG